MRDREKSIREREMITSSSPSRCNRSRSRLLTKLLSCISKIKKITSKSKKIHKIINWSEDLLPELVPLVAQHLSHIDFICFRAVCQSWRRHTSPTGPHRLPLWANIPENSLVIKNPLSRFSHVDPSTMFLHFSGGGQSFSCLNNAAAIPSRHHCIGSGFGWLVIAYVPDSYTQSLLLEVYLLNPVTNARILFPTIKITGFIDKLEYGFKGVKAVLSSHPSSSDCTLVIFRLASERHLSNLYQIIYSNGGRQWDPLSHSGGFHLADVAFHRGTLYIISFNGDVFSWNISGGHILVKPVYHGEMGNLVTTPWGDLLNVIGPSPYKGVRVTRLDFREGGFVDVEDDYLKDRVVVLGLQASYCLSALDCLCLKKNCVYFLGNFMCIYGGYRPGYDVDASMGIYRMRDKGSEPLEPRLSRWPPPIFFLPTLT